MQIIIRIEPKITNLFNKRKKYNTKTRTEPLGKSL